DAGAPCSHARPSRHLLHPGNRITMDVGAFKQILSAFADEPADVDVRLGKAVAQIRDDIIDVTLSADPVTGDIVVTENDTRYPARVWLLNRVARVPQLAERILANVDDARFFVRPCGSLRDD